MAVKKVVCDGICENCILEDHCDDQVLPYSYAGSDGKERQVEIDIIGVDELIVNAYDMKGRTFPKLVMIKVRNGEKVLSFGYPMEYPINEKPWGIKAGYPFEHDVCIDGAGRNHLGSRVFVKKEDMNRIFRSLNIARVEK